MSHPAIDQPWGAARRVGAKAFPSILFHPPRMSRFEASQLSARRGASSISMATKERFSSHVSPIAALSTDGTLSVVIVYDCILHWRNQMDLQCDQ
jgi:hypothetical protein